MENDFSVKIGDFEGPLDILLSLIEKRKLHISQISLAQVTDDYLNHIKALGQVSIANLANFVLVASTLVLIKSLSLLPTIALSEEERGDIHDLEYRLKLYQLFKESAIHLKERFGQQIIFLKSETANQTRVFAPTKEITPDFLRAAILSVIKELPKTETLTKVVIEKIISLEEMIDNLVNRIQKSIRMKFSEFTEKHRDNKVAVIVSFLSMLELVKRGLVEVKQEALWGDIDIEAKEIGVPHYS